MKACWHEGVGGVTLPEQCLDGLIAHRTSSWMQELLRCTEVRAITSSRCGFKIVADRCTLLHIISDRLHLVTVKSASETLPLRINILAITSAVEAIKSVCAEYEYRRLLKI